MHNFPKDVLIGCVKSHTLKEINEILHLAIDNNCKVSNFLLDKKIDRLNPRLFWSGERISNTSIKETDYRFIWVSFEEFKAFLQGKGVYKAPFKQEIKLNIKYKATVTKSDIQVDCQKFTHETVKKLYLASQKAQKS